MGARNLEFPNPTIFKVALNQPECTFSFDGFDLFNLYYHLSCATFGLLVLTVLLALLQMNSAQICTTVHIRTSLCDAGVNMKIQDTATTFDTRLSRSAERGEVEKSRGFARNYNKAFSNTHEEPDMAESLQVEAFRSICEYP